MFTPGDWTVYDLGAEFRPGIDSNPEDGTSLVVFGDPDETWDHGGIRGRTPEEALANARVMAASKDLLEALVNLLAVHEGQGGTKYHAGDIARAAIAKALTGESA